MAGARQLVTLSLQSRSRKQWVLVPSSVLFIQPRTPALERGCSY